VCKGSGAKKGANATRGLLTGNSPHRIPRTIKSQSCPFHGYSIPRSIVVHTLRRSTGLVNE